MPVSTRIILVVVCIKAYQSSHFPNGPKIHSHSPVIIHFHITSSNNSLSNSFFTTQAPSPHSNEQLEALNSSTHVYNRIFSSIVHTHAALEVSINTKNYIGNPHYISRQIFTPPGCG